MVVKVLTSLSTLEELLKSGKLVVIHFWAEWAAQCQQMNEVMEELSKDVDLTIKNVAFVKIAAEDVPEVSLKYNVSAVPTVVLLQGDKVIDRVDGANAAELTKKVKAQAARCDGLVVPKESVEDALNRRIEQLTKMAPVVLFMKGNANEPQCGFSKQAVALLNELDVKYMTFDILSDEGVRQGLKKYSNWPTYPQLYLNGELLGGLDIMKELKESGELEKLLPTKQNLDDRLKSLVNQHELMVFMKGNRDNPRCGFSRQLMAILKETGLEFQTFDILEDEEVRQGLKTFSNWPTYPQIYVKGNLIGGLDIIKELQESNELLATLKGEN